MWLYLPFSYSDPLPFSALLPCQRWISWCKLTVENEESGKAEWRNSVLQIAQGGLGRLFALEVKRKHMNNRIKHNVVYLAG